MAAPRGGTRDRLLDAAEHLFAQYGFDGTSVRAIAQLSGDTVGSFHYHFGSKEELIRQVVIRRFDQIVSARRQRFESMKLADGQPDFLEKVVEAIILPYVEPAMTSEKGWRDYARIISDVLSSPKWYPTIAAQYYDEPAKDLLDLMKRALPDASEKDIGYAYHFILGCMLQCASDMACGRIENLTNGVCKSDDFEAIGPRVVAFAIAGVRAICSNGPPSSE